MKRHWIGLFVALLGLLVILGAAPAAMADDDEVELKAKLQGFQETPAISSGASGKFRGEISSNGDSITYTLSYSGLEGTVTQAHIHFGQRGVAGNIVVFLCQTASVSDPTGLAPTCPQSAPESNPVHGTLTAANMTTRATAQGIVPPEFGEFVRAIRAGVSYANVHSKDAGGVPGNFNGGEIRGQISAHD